MRCPMCRGIDSAVVDSRPRENETQRWRRHECKRCGNQWHTIEISEARYRALLKCEARQRNQEKARREYGR